jgi:GT2 family glycosyltransferase
MDDDIVHYTEGWIDDMEYAIEKDPTIGVCGAKRKDLEQHPEHETDFFRSTLYMIPHQKGERWMVGEVAADIMGSCVMVNSKLIEHIKGLRQPNQYGYDDVDLSIRSRLLGFKNIFLPHILIDHVDKGDTPYQKWKESEAARSGQAFSDLIQGYKNGTIPLYYETQL